jgi:hypothetical protein
LYFCLKEALIMRFTFRLLPLLLLMALAAACAGTSVKSTFSAGGPHPWTSFPAPPAPGQSLRFVVMPDRNGGERKGVFPKAVALAARQDPQFVVSVGDQISGYTSDTQVIEHQWLDFNEVIKPLPSFFYLVGNHDNTTIYQREIWSKRFGPDYYSFNYDGALFLCLNGFEAHDNHFIDWQKPSISRAQVEFVKKALAENPQPRWVFVFIHAPVWLQKNPLPEFLEIESLLQPYQYTMFAGHIHRYQYTQRLGRDYITLATAGGESKLKGVPSGQFDHCLLVTMDGDKPAYRNLLLDGRELPLNPPEINNDLPTD